MVVSASNHTFQMLCPALLYSERMLLMPDGNPAIVGTFLEPINYFKRLRLMFLKH